MVRRFLLVSALLLSGCGQAPVGPAMVAPQGDMQAAGLSTSVKRMFHGIFDRYDANQDGVWTHQDFDLPEDRFLNLFGKTDADDDHVVTKKEYFSRDRHQDMVASCQARGAVSAKAVRGKVDLERAIFVLDVYLQPYLNKQDRRNFIKEAFRRADKNGNETLSATELAHAYAILEAAAEEKGIEKSVNRSKGQPAG